MLNLIKESLMKNILTSTKVTLLSLLIMTSSAAIADISSSKSLSMSGFKIAVIKNSTGTEDIISGNYISGINHIKSEGETVSTFEKSMGLCVANLKVNRLAEAELACTSAIESIPLATGFSRSSTDNRHNKYLKSLAYSNRGIVRYQSNDPLSAIEDFNTAAQLSHHTYIKNNIAVIKTAIASDYSVEMSDSLASE
jgi:hypothetical protein